MSDWRSIVQAHARGLDHVAVAVSDLDASVAHYRDVLCFEQISRLDTRGEATGMRSAVMRLGRSIVVLLEGTEPDSQVSRFVAEHGPGVQHLAIEVDDLVAVVDALRETGASFETPIIEGHCTRQVFTTRDAAVGVRVELIERIDAGFDERSVERLFRTLEAHETW